MNLPLLDTQNAYLITHHAYRRHSRRSLSNHQGGRALRHSPSAGALVVHDRVGPPNGSDTIQPPARVGGVIWVRDPSAAAGWPAALLYGSVARGEEKSGSDVDLMIVGSLKQIDLLSVLRKLESRFRREVNVTLFSSEEFHRKLATGDHFLKAVLKGQDHFTEGCVG
jgi:predicted nucleotidyltransferase